MKLCCGTSDDYVNLIKLTGSISSENDFSYDKVAPVLQAAFKDILSKGVIIQINSGGGSAVQSSLIYNEIVRLKKKYHKTVIAVGHDLLASGAYYIACSADKIYVNPNTIAGSIGVVTESYGVVELAKKIGIENRTHTSGNFKRRLNHFLPGKPDDVAKIKQDLAEAHEDFIAAVKAGRGDRLIKGNKESKESKEEINLFSGDCWTGKRAKELGVVDEFGDVYEAMEKEFDVQRFVYKSKKPPFSLSSLISGSLFGSSHSTATVNVSLLLETEPNSLEFKI